VPKGNPDFSSLRRLRIERGQRQSITVFSRAGASAEKPALAAIGVQ